MLSLFNTTKTEEKPFNFAEQLSKIKNQFKIAHENASNLHAEMLQEIDRKSAQILKIQEEVASITEVKRDTEVFMDNISKLI